MLNSIFWRLFTAMLLAILLFAALAAGVTWYSFQSHISNLDDRYTEYATQFVNSYQDNGDTALKQQLDELKRNEDTHAALFNENGDALTHVPRHIKRQIRRKNILHSQRRHWPGVHRIDITDDSGALFHAIFLTPKEDKRAAKQRRLLAVYIVLGLIILVGFCLLLSWHFSKPIKALRDATNRFSKGNFDLNPEQIKDGRNDEIGQLNSDFIKMASQIKQQFHNQQRLLRDVSHDLRTPLTRQLLAIELAKQNSDTAPAALETIETEIQHMQSLIESVLSLYRLGETEKLENITPINVYAFLTQCCDRWQKVFSNASYDISCDSAIEIHANASLIERAIDNILNNAAQHGDHGQKVQISVVETEQAISINISDTGPGVPAEEIDSLFNAFHQVDSSRFSEHRGLGLGLAIVKQIVDLHKGKINALNTGSGLLMELTLPKDKSKATA